MGSLVLSAVVVNQMPASYKARMHEYPNIRIARPWMNRRGQIEESLMAMGEWRRGEVFVLAGQKIMARG